MESSSFPETIRRRATAGVGVLVIRGLAMRLVGLAANVVLARILVPDDFGLVALGMALLVAGNALADGGLGSALIRRTERPRRFELQALLGLQLALTTLITACVLAAAVPFGEPGLVVAVMVASLPLSTIRTPLTILLERDLRYRSLALIEVMETLAYYAWALTAVAAGAGVWGLATAVLVRPLAGLVIAPRVSPEGFVRPGRFRHELRSLLPFGLRFQAAVLTRIMRDSALYFGTASIAGLAVLGLWTLANRVLEPLIVAFGALGKVAYPAASKLLHATKDIDPVVARATGLIAVLTGVALTPLIASGPALIPLVFGERWQGASDVLPWALALMIAGPTWVTGVGYLNAIGDASSVLRAHLVSALTWLLVGLALLPPFGVSALGIGWFASALIETLVLGRACARHGGFRLWRPLLVPSLAACVAALVGWALASQESPTLAVAAAAGLLAEATYLGIVLIFQRQLVFRAASMVGEAIGGALRGATEAPHG